MDPNPRWTTLVRLVAVLFLGALAVGVAVVLGSVGVAARGTPLEGSWPATLEDGRAIMVRLPLDFRREGIPVDEQLVVELPLSLQRDLEEPAVLLDDVRYHAAVEWDGRPLATMGLDLPGLNKPRRSRMLVELPVELASAGEHTLRLTIAGDHGEGGILGGVRIGSRGELERMALSRTAERLALSAMLVIASVLGLVIASVRPGVREFLWFGIFCAGAAVNAFASDDGWWLVSNRLDLQLRISAAGYALLPGAGLLFAHQLLAERTRPWPAVFFNAGGIVAAFVILWPATSILPVVTRVIDLLAVVAGVLLTGMVVGALRRGVEGASAVALAVALLGGAAIGERAAELAGYGHIRLLLPGFLMFIGTATAAVVLRSTDLADRYKQLVGSARDLILVVLPDGTIEEGNAAAAQVLGADPVGRQLVELVAKDDRERIEEHLRSGLRTVRRAELRLRTREGRLAPFESVATDLPERRIMLAMRDITARRMVEEGMLHAARMETVGIIAGGIAHDFNNTMAALMAHIGLLRLKVPEEGDKQRLDRMEAVIRRAAHMTRRLLTLARGGEKDHRTVNLAEPVHSAVELTRSMLSRTVTIKERIEPDLWQVRGSADDLEQAVLNLLVNARDALQAIGGGTIRVRVRNHREAGLPAGVRIEVIDDGPGIPEHLHASIWEPFFTTKDEGRGTGLGLSVVARVIREHGGQIELKDPGPASEPGRPGTRFVITLPSAGESEPSVTGVTLRGARRVLVVEDEQEIRELMRTELRSRGYEVEAADCAEVALERHAAALDAGQPFHALVTDVVLPGMDGIHMAHRMAREQPNLRVVVASGFIPEHAEALDERWHRLAKPFTIEQLTTALRRALVVPSASDDAIELTGPLPPAPPVEDVTEPVLDPSKS